jgi:hypothetical protein
MKLTKRDVSVLLYIVAILSIFLVYQFYYSSTVKQAETTLTECVGLQQQVDELQAKVAQQPQYEDDIADMKKGISDILALYPASISEEDILLYVKELNDELDMGINGVTFSAATPIYSVVGTGHASTYNFVAESIGISINYSTDYDGLKRIVDYINDDPEHRTITSLSIGINAVDTDDLDMVLNEDGEYETEQVDTITGSIAINLYLIDGKPAEAQGDDDAEEEESRFVIPDVEHGIDDIFRTEGTTSR